MPALHIFNPGHETAVLSGTPYYTPAANVAKIATDLSFLPLWYADSSDIIYTGGLDSREFLKSLPEELGPFASLLEECEKSEKLYTAIPWGHSPQILHTFKVLSKRYPIHLAIPEWDDKFKELTGRQTTIRCHQLLKNLLLNIDIPLPPKTFISLEAIEEYLLHSDRPLVLKTPYSSSGRGIYWLRNKELTNAEKNWIKGAIRKQGFVSLEKGVDKIMDFALEFYSDGNGNIIYQGISIFNTEEKGAYNGNKLASQASLHNEIVALTGSSLDIITESVTEVLKTVYSHQYNGYLGVDMMLYRTGGSIAIHPCVEVNMRFTMGIVALRLFERYIYPDATGNYYVTFDKEQGKALEKHLSLQADHPIEFKDKKITKGYLSLCPVTKETNYRAYLIV